MCYHGQSCQLKLNVQAPVMTQVLPPSIVKADHTGAKAQICSREAADGSRPRVVSGYELRSLPMLSSTAA